MVNQKLGRLFSVGFVSICFCVGISIGITVRFGQLQPSDASTTPSEIPPSPFVIPENKEIPSDTITIKAVGDVIPGTNFPDYRLPRVRDELLPKPVRRYLQGSDIVFGNFESSLTNHPYSTKNVGKGKFFAFRSPPHYAQLFADVGFNVFNLANNHAMDFGTVGFQDTVKHLANVGIKTLGHKNQILYLKINNIPVAMIGFTTYDIYNSVHDLETAKALVLKAKKNANIVIVSMQIGAEGTEALHVQNKTEFFYGENRGNSIKFARTMVDVGADLVIGHGPHVPRALEIYKEKLIAYSLGNFLGYRTLSTTAEAGYSMILEAKLNSKGDLISSKVIPIHLDRHGIPRVDHQFRVVGLLRYLNNQAFPENPVKLNQKGEIITIKRTTN
jgi:hypothetical protein